MIRQRVRKLRTRKTRTSPLKLLRNTVFLMATAFAVVITAVIVPSSTVLAEACTYREALMAVEQGNTMRGLALMRMARLDGDHRANDYLARHGDVAEISAHLQFSQFQAVRPTSGHLALNNPRYRN